jgi:hypothetical protein
MQKAKKPKSTVPAALPEAEPPTVTISDAFMHASSKGLSRMLELLGVRIDVQQLAALEWLADPEHRKIAAMLLKLTAIQQSLALGVVSGQLKIGAKMHEAAEQERRREAALEELARRLQEPHE